MPEFASMKYKERVDKLKTFISTMEEPLTMAQMFDQAEIFVKRVQAGQEKEILQLVLSGDLIKCIMQNTLEMNKAQVFYFPSTKPLPSGYSQI